MITNSNLLIHMTAEDLAVLISNCVQAELKKLENMHMSSTKTEEDTLISRYEASKMLGVSYTTLFHWNNSGILPAQKIGSRVYYLKSSILARLN